MEAYELEFQRQTPAAIAVTIPGDDEFIWLPKSVLDYNEYNDLDYDTLVKGEILDVYIPDNWAEDKGLL